MELDKKETTQKLNNTIEKTKTKKVTKKDTDTAKASTTKKRKTTKVSEAVFVELLGKQINMNDLLKQAEADFREIYPDEEIKDMKVYLNTAEGIAYYVVNDTVEDSFKIVL